MGHFRNEGEAGSGLHNSVFSPSTTAMTVLMNPNHGGAYLQIGLCAACRQPVIIVKGKEEAPSAISGFGDYTISAELMKCVASIALAQRV